MRRCGGVLVSKVPGPHPPAALHQEVAADPDDRGRRRDPANGTHGMGEPGRARSRRLTRFPTTDDERRDLVAFLNSLTDHRFVTDRRLADPDTIDTAPERVAGSHPDTGH